MSLTRREFLRVGAAGAIALAFAGAVKADVPYRPASGDSPLAVLDAGDREVLGAIVPAMLAGTGGPQQVDAVVASVDRALAGLPPHLQREVRQLFALLGLAPVRRFLCGVRAPWPQADVTEVAAFLERWRHSRFALQQQAYLALHELVLASWYARPDAWPAIGYGGPPRLGARP
jgi:hypothetical protein